MLHERLRAIGERFGARNPCKAVYSDLSLTRRLAVSRGPSAREPPPPRPLCKPPAPLVAVPLEIVQGLTQLLVAGPDPAKEFLNV